MMKYGEKVSRVVDKAIKLVQGGGLKEWED